MPRVHGKDLTSLQVDNAGGTAQNLLAETIGLDFKHSVETHDTTTLGDDDKEFTSGLKGGDTFDHELFYNNTSSTGVWAILTGRLGVEGTLTFSDGTRTVTMETIITALSLPIRVNDMMKVTATHQITGAVTYS
jgi:hypothetical protein